MRLYGIDALVYHPIYVALIILVVLPIDGYFMVSGQFLLGLILGAMQLPWMISGFNGKFEYTVAVLKGEI